MIFKNIDFHNVDELVKTENGYLMQRVNSDVLKHLFPAVQERIAYFGTGVELRFVIGSGEVEIDLFIDDNFSDGIVTARPTTVRVFYGDWQSGYKTPDFHLHPGLNTLKLSIPDESELLTKLDGAFDSRVVRIILPQNINEFVDARGDIRLPDKSMYPEKTLLFYGSSITNGADATSVPSTFAFRTAKNSELIISTSVFREMQALKRKWLNISAPAKIGIMLVLNLAQMFTNILMKNLMNMSRILQI